MKVGQTESKHIKQIKGSHIRIYIMNGNDSFLGIYWYVLLIMKCSVMGNLHWVLFKCMHW